MNPNPITPRVERGPSALSSRSCAKFLRAIHKRALAGELDAMAAIVKPALDRLALKQEAGATAA